MGIIELPDNAHEKGETTLEDKLVRWISRERIPIVTGNFGKNNQPLIASTAVAAQATVRCRIRTFFDWDTEHRINHKSTHWDLEFFRHEAMPGFCRKFAAILQKKNQSGHRGNGSAVATMAAARRMAVERTDRRP